MRRRLTMLVLALLVAASPAAAQEDGWISRLAPHVKAVADALKGAPGGNVAVLPLGTVGQVDPAVVSTVSDQIVVQLAALFRSNDSKQALVERAELDRILSEQRVTAGAGFDERDALRLGRLAAADFLLLGSASRSGDAPRLTLSLRLLDVVTGRVVEARQVPLDLDAEGRLAGPAPQVIVQGRPWPLRRKLVLVSGLAAAGGAAALAVSKDRSVQRFLDDARSVPPGDTAQYDALVASASRAAKDRNTWYGIAGAVGGLTVLVTVISAIRDDGGRPAPAVGAGPLEIRLRGNRQVVGITGVWRF